MAFDISGPLPDRTLVLEASAGTGKTSAIAGLAARFVAERGVPLQKVMIATFSGASTREVRARVREELEAVERALSGSDPEPTGPVPRLLAADPAQRAGRLARVREALAGFDAATICTTHQFCDRMLAELGVLVDHDPGTALVDDLSGLLEQTVADEYLNRYLDAPEPPFDLKSATLLGEYAALRSPALPLAPEDATDRAGERVSFAAAVRGEVENRKHRQGLYTFDDMQLRLRDALRSSQADRARAVLRERFPVVLIDEFQDTDPVQWEIVRLAFCDSGTVVLIGDPKQSIYGFRGADVYAYLSAVSEHTVQSLDTNHRSDPRVVKALQRLFQGAALGDPRIVVHDVGTSPTAPRLETTGPWRDPVRLRFAPTMDSAPSANRAIDADLVTDVAGLLAAGVVVHRPRELSSRSLAAGDIAVIVTTNNRGQAIRGLLAQAGIPSVFNGSSSVLSSDAAQDWVTLLTAFARPRTKEVRSVALTDFVGWTPARLTAADEGELGLLSQRVRAWHRLASESGVAALFERMTAADGVYDRLLRQRGGDRVVTDLRHVADLLQAQQSRGGLGTAQLLTWLTDQRHRDQASRDERSRRLETDADAVQVMTVHQAKGLQFPVVYVPEMSTHSTWRDLKHPRPFQFHVGTDGGARRWLDVGGPNAAGAQARRARHADEEAGERLRWLYVALTRAECHVTMWWVPTKATPTAPLHRILFRDTSTPTVPLEVPLDGRLPDTLGRLAGSEIATEPMAPMPPAAYRPDLPNLVEAAEFEREVDLGWRRTSYSGLTAAAHHDPADELLLTDEPPDSDDSPPPQAHSGGGSVTARDRLAEPSPMADLPGGVAFGSLVHAVYERFDPSEPGSLAEIVRVATGRLPVPDVVPEALAAAMVPALETPLGPLFDGLRLRDIPARDRLAELDFELPLGRDGAPCHGVGSAATIEAVARLLRHHLPAGDLLAPYPERLRTAGLTDDPLRGFLTGSIDAAIRVGNRVVVVDYKTNRLCPPGVGLTLGHYTATAMAEAMMASHYPLQALLYSVAMHRFLRWRWRGYDPAAQLGGVAYLFVRGMAGEGTPVVDGMPTGVFAWRPPCSLVTELSDLLGGTGGDHDRRTAG